MGGDNSARGEGAMRVGYDDWRDRAEISGGSSGRNQIPGSRLERWTGNVPFESRALQRD